MKCMICGHLLGTTILSCDVRSHGAFPAPSKPRERSMPPACVCAGRLPPGPSNSTSLSMMLHPCRHGRGCKAAGRDSSIPSNKCLSAWDQGDSLARSVSGLQVEEKPLKKLYFQPAEIQKLRHSRYDGACWKTEPLWGWVLV